MWALSELLVRRMRLVLPGILLSIFFVIFVHRAVPFDLLSWNVPADARLPGSLAIWQLLLGSVGSPGVLVVKALVGSGASALYYWRFRLPFALLIVAAGLVLATVTAAPIVFGQFGNFVHDLIILFCGLAVFAVAMTFDMSDRERLTRRADCAFWLHLLAAPLLVHSLIALFVPQFLFVTGAGAVVILMIIAVLAVVAIAIDRRALLVSALAYLGIVISYAIGGTNFLLLRDGSVVFFTTLLILGSGVIALGVGWLPLRRWLIKHISPALSGRLPPVPQT